MGDHEWDQSVVRDVHSFRGFSLEALSGHRYTVTHRICQGKDPNKVCIMPE